MIPYQIFVDNHNIRNFPFTHYYGIIAAIPSSWKSNLRDINGFNLNECRLLKFASKQRSTNFLYKSILSDKSSTPRALAKWEAMFPQNNFNWKSIFMLPFIAVREAKIQYLQFRYIHRIIGTNEFLFRIKMNDSPLCSFCNLEEETLIHLFWHCPFVKRFWDEISLSCLKEESYIEELNVHFGYLENGKNIINFFILHAKNFIFSCKQKGVRPDAMTFYYKFRFSLEVEISILKKQNNFELANKYESHFIGV